MEHIINQLPNVPYVHVGYYPSNYVLENDPNVVLTDPYLLRSLIWKFKSGQDQTWPLAIAEQMIAQKLQSLPNIDRSKLALVCLPASTQIDNINRFQDFSIRLSNYLGLNNGFDHITINKDKAPKYQYINGLSSEWDMSQDLQFDEQFFVGKDIILFDDIVTTGETMFAFYTKLRALGANILFCASLLYTPDLRCL